MASGTMIAGAGSFTLLVDGGGWGQSSYGEFGYGGAGSTIDGWVAFSLTSNIGAGSFALTGGAVGFDLTMPAGSGAFLLSGSEATLTSRVIGAESGGFTLMLIGDSYGKGGYGDLAYGGVGETGDGWVNLNQSIAFGSAAFTITPNATRGYGEDGYGTNPYGGAGEVRLIETLFTRAAAASFLMTGGSVTLPISISTPASAGSFTLTGADIELPLERVFSSGSFTLTGADVGLSKSQVILDAASGSFAVSGSDVSILESSTIDIAAGSFALSGGDVTLPEASIISAASGDFAMTGGLLLIKDNLAVLVTGLEVSTSTDGAGVWERIAPPVDEVWTRIPR